MAKVLDALRSKKTTRVMQALNLLTAAVIMSGVPVPDAAVASWLAVVAVVYELTVGAPKPGADGDPETPL